jgi:hypothetical protein
MTNEAVKVNLVLANGLKQGLLSNGNGAGSGRRSSNVTSFGANDCDLPVALNWVRKADAVLDNRPVACSFEVDVNFVFDGRRGLADFDSSEDAGGGRELN